MTQPQPAQPLDLDTIQARCDAATPGPWMVLNDQADLTRWVTDDAGGLQIGFGYLGNRTQAEAEFVAHARTDIPKLIARVRELEAEQARLRSVLASTQQLANLDSVTCLSCGHLETAHDPDGDRDCTASGAQVVACSCLYFIPCYPEPAARARDGR